MFIKKVGDLCRSIVDYVRVADTEHAYNTLSSYQNLTLIFWYTWIFNFRFWNTLIKNRIEDKTKSLVFICHFHKRHNLFSLKLLFFPESCFSYIWSYPMNQPAFPYASYSTQSGYPVTNLYPVGNNQTQYFSDNNPQTQS